MSNYFSPDNIRNRYSKHISDDIDEQDMIFLLAKNSINMMRKENLSDEEIVSVLVEKYHFSNEIINNLLAQESEV
ncbi:MAG: hypothetical protein K6B67_06550 [Lachnospiraceae bacterium]|nr:hypothetical protein [Lachnospiraceae bacterium]